MNGSGCLFRCRTLVSLWNNRSMKRTVIFLATGFVLVILVMVVATRGGRDATAPRFVPGAPAFLPPFTSDHCNWITDAPFQGGKTWMWTIVGTNNHVYLYDLEKHEVL